MTDLYSEVKDIVAKYLPAATGDFLRARLEQADRDTEQVKVLTRERDQFRFESERLRAKEKEQERLDAFAAALAKRDKELDVREQKLAIGEAVVKANEERVKDIKELALIAFQHKLKAVESTSRTRSILVPNNYYSQSVTEYDNKTIETSPA